MKPSNGESAIIIHFLFILYLSPFPSEAEADGRWGPTALIFEDHFDGNALDLTKWEYQTGCTAIYGAGNYQCYTAGTNNVQVGNGKLTIRANIENYLNKNFTSGRIRQLGNGTLYGTFEIRAKLPNGLLLFPALWLKSKSGACYSEIDMIETKGQQPNRLVFTSFYGTIATLVKRGLAPVTTIDSSQRFHVYRLHWTPSRIAWYINRELFFNVSTDSSQWTNPNSPTTCSQAPFIQPMSLIINMAVGSAGMFGNGNNITIAQAQEWSQPILEVDYVRVSQRIWKTK